MALPEGRIRRIRELSVLESAALFAELRKPDQDELSAVTGHSLTALQKSVEISKECWGSYEADTGNLLAIFGLCSVLPGAGIPWMVGTDLIFKYPIRFMKISTRVVDRWLRQYGVLHNVVDARNEAHVKWLKHMDFCFDGQTTTINSIPFLYFYKENSTYSKLKENNYV